MSTDQDINAPAIAVIGVLGAVGLLMIVLLLQAMYYHVAARQTYEKDISQPPVELDSLLAQQQARLVEYRWVNREKQVVAIPISRAMELVVAESDRQPPEPGGKRRPEAKRPATEADDER